MSSLVADANSFDVYALYSESAIDYVHLPFKESEQHDLDQLIALTAQTSLIQMCKNGLTMLSLRDRISSLHPLKFLSRILMKANRKFTLSILSAKPKSYCLFDLPMFVKRKVLTGLYDGFTREDTRGNLKQYLDDFIQELKELYPREELTEEINQKFTLLKTTYATQNQWQEFVNGIINIMLRANVANLPQ